MISNQKKTVIGLVASAALVVFFSFIFLPADNIVIEPVANLAAETDFAFTEDKAGDDMDDNHSEPKTAVEEEPGDKDQEQLLSEDELLMLALAQGTPEERLNAGIESLLKKIKADDRMLEHPVVGANYDYVDIRLNMMAALEEDPSLLNGLIDRFVEDPNSLLGRELSAILSETAAPEVQTAVLDIAFNEVSYHEKDERLSALMVVAEMDSVTGETRDRLLNSFASEQDSEVLQVSLMAMKPAPSTPEDYARVHETLGPLTMSNDENVRRHSAFQVEQWATSSDDLAPLRTLAIQDENVNTRARAAMSLATSSFKSDENKAVLWQVVNNNNEPPVVRQYVWNELTNWSMSPEELAQYEYIGSEINQAVEAGRSENMQ